MEKMIRRIRLLPMLIYALYVLAFVFFLKVERSTFRESISCDLLVRVVGSRLMADKKPAYFDDCRSEKQNPSRYYHPYIRPFQKINGVTVTPGMLWLNSIFNDLEFCTTRDIWFYFQIGLLFLTGLLLLLSFKDVKTKLLILLILVPFFVCSRNFILHLNSAQVYIIYACVFTLLYLLIRSEFKWKYIAVGVLITLSAWLKPFFLVLFLPLLIRKEWNVLKGAIPTAAILLIHAIAFNHINYWKEYAKAMPEYAQDIPLFHKGQFMKRAAPNFPVSQCIYPVKSARTHPLTSAGLHTMENYVFMFGGSYSGTTAYAFASILIIIAITLFTRRRSFGAEKMVALMYLLYLTVELLAPTLRFGYNVVQWLMPCVAVIICYKNNRLAAALMLIGLIINHGYIYVPFPKAYCGAIGELLMIFSLASFILLKDSSDLDHST